MNVNRVGLTSFGRAPYYTDIKRKTFEYNCKSPDSDYKLNAIYSMLEVIRDEQREQAKILADNQTVLRNLACDIARDFANAGTYYATASKYTYSRGDYHLNTTA